MKRFLFLFICFYIQTSFICGVEVHSVPKNKIQRDLHIDLNKCIRDLDEWEIFNVLEFLVHDECIYIIDRSRNIFQLSLKGDFLKKAMRIGEGPLEAIGIGGLVPVKEGIAVYDNIKNKLIILTKDLNLVKEQKTKKSYLGLLGYLNQHYIFSNYQADPEGCYFDICDKNGIKTGSFGQERVRFNPNLNSIRVFDSVRCSVLFPQQNGLLAAYLNRYDLEYFENNQLKKEVKETEDFFKYEIDTKYGVKIRNYNDWAVRLAQNGDTIFYFFYKDKNLYCDRFDANFDFRERLKLDIRASFISHYRGNIFFFIVREKDDKLKLYREEIK